MKCKKQIIIGIIVIIALLIFSSQSLAKIAIVNVDTLKLREEASLDSNILKLLNLGEKLDIIEESGDWYKVKVDNNNIGYVHRDYVKIQDDNQKTANNEQTNTEINEQENITIDENNTTVVNEEINTQNIDNNEKSNTEKKEYEPKQVKLIKDVNCFILPLINSNILDTLKKDEEIIVNNEINGWWYIETDKITGWILANSIDIAIIDENNTDVNIEIEEDEIINNDDENKANENELEVTKISEKTMYVNTPSIYVRKGPGTNFEVVDSLVLNASVIVTGEIEDWYQVKLSDITGFVAKRLLSNNKTEDTTSRSSEERNGEAKDINIKNEVSTSKGQDVVNYAKQYLNCKYVYGGSGPSTFDCSGFTMYVYKHFGISLSHSATAQSKVGTYIAKENLQPGDLVFFKDYQTMDGIGHCGIYIGDGNFIHASSGTGYCVKISTLLSGSYNTRYATARRII